MNHEEKFIQRKIGRQLVSVAAIITIAGPAIMQSTHTLTVQAEEVNVTTNEADVSSKFISTATIKNDKITTSSASNTIKITSKTSEKVGSGDTVQYTLKNISLYQTDLKSTDLKLADGTVIGKINLKTTDTNVQPKTVSDTMQAHSAGAIITVTFNDAVTNRQDIEYSINFNNITHPVSVVNRDTPMTQTITSGGKRLAINTVTIPKINPIDYKSSHAIISGYSNVTLDDSGKVSDSTLLLSVMNTTEQPIKDGDSITLTLDDSSDIRFDPSSIKVGTTAKSNGDRTIAPNTPVTSNGLYALPDMPTEWEITAVTDSSITIKKISGGDFSVDRSYTLFNLKNAIKLVDTDDLNVTNKEIQNIPVITTFKDYPEYSVKNIVKVVGSGANALANLKQGSVSYKLLVEGTNNVLADGTLKELTSVGTSYDGTSKFPATFEKDGKKYELVSMPKNVKGSIAEGNTMITGYYKEAPDLITQPNKNPVQISTEWIDQDGKALKDKVTGTETQDAGEIDGYDFVETKTLDNGSVQHIFKAKEEPVKEEPVKEEPVKEEPVKEEPVKEEPVKEEPVKEEPVTDQSPTPQTSPVAKPTTFANTGANVIGSLFATLTSIVVALIATLGIKYNH